MSNMSTDVAAGKRKLEPEETVKKAKIEQENVKLKELVISADSQPFSKLCDAFESIEATTKRLAIVEILTCYFTDIAKECPDDLLPSVYLCLNQIAPTYEGIELGIGENLLAKSISEVTGRTIQAIKSDVKVHGDLGLVAKVSRTNQKTMFAPKPLSIQSIFKAFRDIALISGKDSMQRKADKIKSMIVACQGSEVKFLIRILEGKLRIGLAEKSMLTALAGAIVRLKHPTEKNRTAEAVEILKSIFNETPSYDLIVPALLEHGVFDLGEHCIMKPGIPLKPMLAHPTKSLGEVLNRFEGKPFTCEFKYDGERAQVHYVDGIVYVYSRNSENMSQKYPDIVDKVKKICKETTNSFIIDCEVVAYDVDKNCILPFQVLSTRKRKDVSVGSISVQVCLFAFDILYLNGTNLLKETFEKRRNILMESFSPVEGDFNFAKHMDSTTTEDIQLFLEEAVQSNCEGLMVKTLVDESSYEPSKRSRNWLKVKKDYISGMGDSIDLVVIGGYLGRGKRVGNYGGFLLACYDDETEEYQTICKIGTGFSDSQLEEHTNFLKSHVITDPPSYYSFKDGLKPDVWFDAVQVWEVKAADLSISPVYKAAEGLIDQNKGISLRFPRFIRIRDDKKPEMATSASQIAELYKNQASVNNEPENDDSE